MKINTDNGKYTFEVAPNGAVYILRGGEQWVGGIPGSNAIHSLLCELDAARLVIAAVRLIQDEHPALRFALQKHAALVDDRELPSEWAAT